MNLESEILYHSSEAPHPVVQDDAQAATIMRCDSREAPSRRMQINAQRFDSVFEGRGMIMARELEHTYSEVMRDVYAPNSALELFPIDSSVPEGAKTHRVKRISHTGEARYYRGNSKDIPEVGAKQDVEDFPILPIITSIRVNFFEQKNAEFARSNLRGELEFSANQAISDFLNDKTWHGDEDHGMLGVLNYPYTPKTVSAVKFDDTSTSTELYDELTRLANMQSEVTKTRFKPDTLALPDGLRDYLNDRCMSVDNNTSILERFLQKNSYINEVIPVPELAAAGPGGRDVLLFYKRNDPRSISNVIPRGMSMLPAQVQGFDILIPVYAMHGGVIERNALNNLLAYVES